MAILTLGFGSERPFKQQKPATTETEPIAASKTPATREGSDELFTTSRLPPVRYTLSVYKPAVYKGPCGSDPTPPAQRAQYPLIKEYTLNHIEDPYMI